MEAADHGVDLRDAADPGRVAADADDPAVGARGHDDQPAVPDVGDQRLLADEGVLDEGAGLLHAEGRRDRLVRLGRPHLAGEEHALRHGQGLGDVDHVQTPAGNVAPIEAAKRHAVPFALHPARHVMIGMPVEPEVRMHLAPVRGQEPEQTAEMVRVAVGERERVDLPRVEAELAEVVGHRRLGEPEIEADGGRLAAPGHLHVVGEPVLGAEVGDLARPRHAPAARDLLVRPEDVDRVVDDGGDGQAVDRRERHRLSTTAGGRGRARRCTP